MILKLVSHLGAEDFESVDVVTLQSVLSLFLFSIIFKTFISSVLIKS